MDFSSGLKKILRPQGASIKTLEDEHLIDETLIIHQKGRGTLVGNEDQRRILCVEIAYQLWFTVGRMHTEYAILLLDGTRSSIFPGQSFWLLTVAFQFSSG